MGLLGSAINVVKSIGYILTGNMDDLAVMWSSNPAAIRAKGAGAVKGMQKRLGAIAKALSPQHVQIERYKGQIDQRQKRLAEIPGLMNGAMAKVQQILTAKNLTKEQATNDPDVIKYLKTHSDLKAELTKKTNEVNEFNAKVLGIKTRIATLEMQGAELKKKIENAGAEVEETVAVVISSREEQKANAAFTGLGKDTSQADLDDLRKIREKAEGDAAAARSLSGMEVSSVEAELKEAGAALTSLDALDGLRFAESTPTTPTPVLNEKLPEH
jgi:chromosome segregation ATPase